jgi:hypothetical protein
MTAQTVREIAASSFTDAIEMLGLVEVLEAGNQRPIIQALNEAGAGRAAEHNDPCSRGCIFSSQGLTVKPDEGTAILERRLRY